MPKGLWKRLVGMYSPTSSEQQAKAKEFQHCSLPAALRVYHARLLPPQQGMQRQTLVLDLDRTLIDCISIKEHSDSEPDFIYTDAAGLQAKVWLRPFLQDFLEAVSRDFEVVLFTAAGARHADTVLRHIDPEKKYFSHRLYGQHTSECKQWGWVKDLSRLGRSLSSTLLVDDSQLAGLMQPCNLVPIRPYMHENPMKEFDTALPEMLRFLREKVLHAHDVREAIASHWNKISRCPRRKPLQPLYKPPSVAPSSEGRSSNSSDCSIELLSPTPLPPTISAPVLLDIHSNKTSWDSERRAEPPIALSISQPAELTDCFRESLHRESSKPDLSKPLGKCAAAHLGCGCHFSLDELANLAASLASLQHIDVGEDDSDEPETHHHHQPPSQGMKRSHADRQLSSRCAELESQQMPTSCRSSSSVSDASSGTATPDAQCLLSLNTPFNSIAHAAEVVCGTVLSDICQPTSPKQQAIDMKDSRNVSGYVSLGRAGSTDSATCFIDAIERNQDRSNNMNTHMPATCSFLGFCFHS